jgi:type IV secretion system protein TrbF
MFPKFTSSFARNGVHQKLESPYARAAAEWDNRIGSARVQAKNWRLVAVGCVLLALISTSAAVYLAINKQVATYVVEVDKFGMPSKITLASTPYQPQSAQVGYFVGQLVRLARERPLDPVVMRQQWTKVYEFLAGQAVNTMNEFAASDTGLNALPGRGAIARTVEISNILQKSPDTFQIRWLETSYANGMKKSQEEWTGLFQVKLIPPRNEGDAFKNPLGVYVTHFTWSREFSGPVTSELRPQAKPQ